MTVVHRPVVAEGDALIAELVPGEIIDLTPVADETIEMDALDIEGPIEYTYTRDDPNPRAQEGGHAAGRLGLPIRSGLISLFLGGPLVWLIMFGLPAFILDWINARTAGVHLWRWDMTDHLHLDPGSPFAEQFADTAVLAVVVCCLTLMACEQFAAWASQRGRSAVE